MASTPSTPRESKRAPLKDALLIAVSLVALVVVGWYVWQKFQPEKYSFIDIANVPLETNEEGITAAQLLDLPLVNDKGEPVSLRERLGQEHLVIVFTRGSLATVPAASKGPQFPHLPNVCPYCTSQATGIASRMGEFKQQQAAVLLVFPVTELAQNVDAATFVNSTVQPGSSPPFPVLLDLQLAAVDKLGLREHLARPASFIIDKAGNLRFAYVARRGSADRPSGGELLRRVQQISAESSPPPP